MFLTRGAAVPGGLALRANFEVLQKAQNLASFVAAKRSPLQRSYTKHIDDINDIMTPLPQPLYHACQDIRGDVVTLCDPSRRGDPGGLPHKPSDAGVGKV